MNWTWTWTCTIATLGAIAAESGCDKCLSRLEQVLRLSCHCLRNKTIHLRRVIYAFSKLFTRFMSLCMFYNSHVRLQPTRENACFHCIQLMLMVMMTLDSIRMESKVTVRFWYSGKKGKRTLYYDEMDVAMSFRIYEQYDSLGPRSTTPSNFQQ